MGSTTRKIDITIILLIWGAGLSLLAFVGFITMGAFSKEGPLAVMAAVGVAVAVLCMVTAIIFRRASSGALLFSGRLSHAADAIADLEALSRSLADFSRGNLTVQPESKTASNSEENQPPATTDEAYECISRLTRDSLDSFKSLTAVPLKRLCYVGADSFREGEACGRAMAELLPNGGEVAIFINFWDVVSANARRKGFESALRDRRPQARVATVIEEHEDLDLAYSAAVSCLERFPGLSAFYVADGSVPAGVARALQEKGSQAFVVCHDLTSETMAYIKKGRIRATLSQNPFVQGHDPVIHLYNFLNSRQPLPVDRLLTRVELVTPENYQTYWSQDDAMLISKSTEENLARSLSNRSGESFKIGVIVPGDAGFWKPMVEGVVRAREELQEQGATVSLSIPQKIKDGDWSVANFEEAIERLASEGCQAVALPVFKKELVPFINVLAGKGIVFATMNGEPLSFRGIIMTISDHTAQLFSSSELLSAGSVESYHATAQISETMDQILSANKRQMDVIDTTYKAVDALASNIAHVEANGRESLLSAEAASSSAGAGQQVVEQSAEAMDTLKKVAGETTEAINRLEAQTRKISEILGIITDIAEKTSLLAINASIEAAHAGERGKGFAIVAQEIRSLSERSQRANSDIASNLNAILESVSDAGTSVVASAAVVGRNYQLSEQVRAAFRGIAEASESLRGKNESMMKASAEMARLSGTVKDSMGELVTVNSRNSDAIEEIAVSAREIRDQVQEMSKTSQILTDMARSEEDLFKQLIIE